MVLRVSWRRVRERRKRRRRRWWRRRRRRWRSPGHADGREIRASCLRCSRVPFATWRPLAGSQLHRGDETGARRSSHQQRDAHHTRRAPAPSPADSTLPARWRYRRGGRRLIRSRSSWWAASLPRLPRASAGPRLACVPLQLTTHSCCDARRMRTGEVRHHWAAGHGSHAASAATRQRSAHPAEVSTHSPVRRRAAAEREQEVRPAARPPSPPPSERRVPPRRVVSHAQQLKHALTVSAAHVITHDYLCLSQAPHCTHRSRTPPPHHHAHISPAPARTTGRPSTLHIHTNVCTVMSSRSRCTTAYYLWTAPSANSS